MSRTLCPRLVATAEATSKSLKAATNSHFELPETGRQISYCSQRAMTDSLDAGRRVTDHNRRKRHRQGLRLGANTGPAIPSELEFQSSQSLLLSGQRICT